MGTITFVCNVQHTFLYKNQQVNVFLLVHYVEHTINKGNAPHAILVTV